VSYSTLLEMYVIGDLSDGTDADGRDRQAVAAVLGACHPAADAVFAGTIPSRVFQALGELLPRGRGRFGAGFDSHRLVRHEVACPKSLPDKGLLVFNASPPTHASLVTERYEAVGKSLIATRSTRETWARGRLVW
jgi:hypothetical protein